MNAISLQESILSTRPLVVRAVDVGYGHIKFSDGRKKERPASHSSLRR